MTKFPHEIMSEQLQLPEMQPRLQNTTTDYQYRQTTQIFKDDTKPKEAKKNHLQ